MKIKWDGFTADTKTLCKYGWIITKSHDYTYIHKGFIWLICFDGEVINAVSFRKPQSINHMLRFVLLKQRANIRRIKAKKKKIVEEAIKNIIEVKEKVKM